jgi:hypothetical protein
MPTQDCQKYVSGWVSESTMDIWTKSNFLKICTFFGGRNFNFWSGVLFLALLRRVDGSPSNTQMISSSSRVFNSSSKKGWTQNGVPYIHYNLSFFIVAFSRIQQQRGS